MAHPVSNTNPAANATFQDWLNNSVLMGQLMTGNVITTAANSAGELTNGNSFVNGVFCANVLIANVSLSGGTLGTPANLLIISNVDVTGLTITIGNSSVNTVINSSSVTTANIFGTVDLPPFFFGNSTVNALANSIILEYNTPTSTLSINDSILSIGNSSVNVVVNSITIEIAGATINSSFYTGEANNSNNFGGQPPSYYIGLAGSSNNSLYLGGIAANGYAVLVNNSIFVGNNTFGGTNTVFTSNVIIRGNTLANNITANNITANGLTVNSISSTNTIVSNNAITGLTIGTNNSIIASNLTTITSNSQTIIDSFPKINSRCAQYIIFVYNVNANNLVHTINITMIHDGNTSIFQTQYAELYNTNLGSFDSAINSANVELYFTGPTANSSNTFVVKVQRTQIV